MTSIGNSAFDYCTSLKHVTIPDSVISIDRYAFAYSDSLKSKYQAIAAVEAPKDLEDKRLALKGHADNLCTMLDDSIELYTIAGEALSKDLTEEQISRINILQTEIGQLQGSADSFDSILNEIMAAE